MSKLKFKKKQAYFNLALIIVFAIFLLFLINKDIVFGSVRGNWFFTYIDDFKAETIIFTIPMVLVVLLLAFLTHRYSSRHGILFICLWFFFGSLLQIAIHRLYPFSFEEIIESDRATSFYTATVKYSFPQFLHSMDSFKRILPHHSRYNMPGKIFFYFLLKIFTSSPKVMGYVIILLSNIGSILVYLISKKLFKNRRIAIYSMAFYLFIPAKLFFFPTLNTVTPVFILFSFLLYLLYLDSHKKIYLILLGFSIYFILFFEPLSLVLGIVFIAFTLKYFWQGEMNELEVLRIAFYFVLSFLFVHLICLIFFQYNILSSFLYAVGEVSAFNQLSGRGYGLWIFENLKEFFINCGVVCSICFFVFIVSFFIGLPVIHKSKKTRETRLKRFILKPGRLFPFSFFLTLIFLEAFGINRGEITRHWIFLAVFVQMIVAYFCVTKLNKMAFYLILISAILQSAVTIRMVGFVLP